jgi:patatin-like phospholipase/acyl hydrolase
MAVVQQRERPLYRGGDKLTRHNADQRLCDLLAASTAAPAFFPSVTLDLGAGPREYVDGGVTAHNNPALQMFLTATLPEYEMRWPVGSDKLLLISVGTGFAPARLKNLIRLRRHIIYVATNTPAGLMFAAANHNDVVCRTFGDTRFGPCLDNELGRMIPGGLPNKLFTYARYNINLDHEEIEQYGLSMRRPTN